MKGILIQQKVFKAIDGKYADNVSDKKLENDEYAYSSIILNLSDSVIRKVGKQVSAKMLWDKLEELYTETSLPSDKNIDDYSPIVLLNAIPETYGDVKAAIKYGRDNVQLETVVSGLKNKKEWIIDSGCTFHMTPFREILSNYKTEKLGCVSMANEKLCAVHGLGDVCMIFENGFKLTLKNVRHVPDLAQNLISCSALEEEVHQNVSDLWHKRLGHISSKGYRLWLRNQPGYKVIVSRDVTFNESEFPCLANSSKKDLDHNIESTFNKVEDNPEDNQQGEEVVIEENQQLENEEQNENNTPSIRDYQLARDRERRTTRIPSKLRDFDIALNIDTSEPFSYKEAIESKNSENWINAMNEEIDSLNKNNTWTLVPKPKEVTAVD
ncbi:hypothetical protein Sango_2073600, partial [Sesamum angolense]